MIYTHVLNRGGKGVKAHSMLPVTLFDLLVVPRGGMDQRNRVNSVARRIWLIQALCGPKPFNPATACPKNQKSQLMLLPCWATLRQP